MALLSYFLISNVMYTADSHWLTKKPVSSPVIHEYGITSLWQPNWRIVAPASLVLSLKGDPIVFDVKLVDWM